MVFAVFPWAYLALKTAGAAYLIWIAVQMCRHSRHPLAVEAPQAGTRRAYLSGILVNLANPKSVFFAGAVIVVIFPAELSMADKVLIFCNLLAVELIMQPMLALLLSTPAVRARYIAAKPALDRAAGTVLGVLGLRLALDRSL